MRLADAGMGDQMVEYCLYGVLHFHRDMDHYRRDQAEGGWTPRPFVAASQRRVGVLGLGTLGAQVADAASAFGLRHRRLEPVAEGVAQGPDVFWH